MIVRKIVERPGSPKLGLMTSSASSRAKKSAIKELFVWQENDGHSIGVRLNLEGGKTGIIDLSQTAAIELAKGILQNLHDVSIAVDEELQDIIKQAVARCINCEEITELAWDTSFEERVALVIVEDEFWLECERLAKLGKCDSPGGMEYRRVRLQWEHDGKPSNIEEFIIRESNAR